MKKLIAVAKATLFAAVLTLTLMGMFPTASEALWVACWNPGGDACTVTFYEDDQRIAEFYYNNWAMGN